MFFQSAIGCLAEEETSVAAGVSELTFSSLHSTSTSLVASPLTTSKGTFDVRSTTVEPPLKVARAAAERFPSSAIRLRASERRSQSAVTLLFSNKLGLSAHAVNRFKILVLFCSHISGDSAPAKTQSTSSSLGR